MIKNIRSFLAESIVEWNHVSWPTRHQAIQATIVTLGVTAVAALYLVGLDAVLRAGLDFLILHFR